MASNVTRDHHRWTRDITSPQDTTIDVKGDLIVDVSGGQFTITDNSIGDPDLIIDSNSDDSASGNLIFDKDRAGTSGHNGDILGGIIWKGYNQEGTPVQKDFALLKGNILDAASGQETGTLTFQVRTDTFLASELKDALLLSGSPTDDLVNVTIANGAASLTTIAGDLDIDGDAITSAGALEIDPGGALSITGAHVNIDATQKLSFDGGSDTYITESSADVLDIKVGDDLIFQITERGDDGNTIDIEDACIGFTQLEPTYDATTTNVDFRFSNKQFLTFDGGNITNLALFFPLVSGNFVLLLKQDGTGSRLVTNYKAMEFDESSADGAAAVKFPGGSSPTLTTDANHVDIISFYWDADNEIAYGVATLDFQF